MKILLINSVSGIRSTGRIVADLADKYISEGHECKIAYGRGEVPQKYRDISYRIGTDLSVMINAVKARFFDNEAFNAKRETKKFIKWADKYNPDVLWLHNLHGYYLNIELLFDWIKTRPQMEVKWTLHDCWPFTGHCPHFTLAKCQQWKNGCYKCSQTREYPKGMFSDNCKLNYARKKNAFSGVKNMTLITPSNWLASLVKESFLKNYPVEVIHNTIDVNVFKPTVGDFREKYNLQNKFIVLGVASAWSDKKGLSDFVKLSKMLDENCAVVLVGLTAKQIKKIPESIISIERTNSAKELAHIYTTVDVFLNLTYEDNYPTVNLEAQACGTPCITYRTGGSVESVEPDCVVEQGDLDSVVTLLNNLRNK